MLMRYQPAHFVPSFHPYLLLSVKQQYLLICVKEQQGLWYSTVQPLNQTNRDRETLKHQPVSIYTRMGKTFRVLTCWHRHTNKSMNAIRGVFSTPLFFSFFNIQHLFNICFSASFCLTSLLLFFRFSLFFHICYCYKHITYDLYVCCVLFARPKEVTLLSSSLVKDPIRHWITESILFIQGYILCIIINISYN